MPKKLLLTEPGSLRYVTGQVFLLTIYDKRRIVKTILQKTDKEMRECLNYQKNK